MDAALIEVPATGLRRPRLLAFLTRRYGEGLRARLARAAAGEAIGVPELAALDRAIAVVAAQASRAVCKRAGIDLADVAVIGSHGQTLYHRPPGRSPGLTWQIGAAARIAQLTGVPTVGDFRTADVSAGGHGAPLMPLIHRELLAHPRRRRAVQNLGGIGNVTWLAPGGQAMVAFDTGPGIMVIDAVVRSRSGGRAGFDRDGRMAARGRVDGRLLGELMRDDYLAQPPPKSTGRERYGDSFTARLLARANRRHLCDDDIVATATAFTAATVADQYARFLARRGIDEVLLAGGGARNPTLVGAIRASIAQRLGAIPVRPSDELGFDADALEAVGFALLGVAAIAGRRFDLSAITGAKAAVRLGVVALGPAERALAVRGCVVKPEQGRRAGDGRDRAVARGAAGRRPR